MLLCNCQQLSQAKYDKAMLKQFKNAVSRYVLVIENKLDLASFSFVDDFKVVSMLSVYNCSNVNITRPSVNVTDLRLTYCDIQDIEGIQYMQQLQVLRLTDNKIQSILQLSAQHNLTELDLYRNKITIIDPLKNLLQLQSMILFENSISDLSPLRLLVNLHFLDLTSNRISNIYYLRFLNNLKSLWLGNNSIVDLSPLQGIQSLTELVLNNNKIVHFNLNNQQLQNVVLDQNYIEAVVQGAEMAEQVPPTSKQKMESVFVGLVYEAQLKDEKMKQLQTQIKIKMERESEKIYEMMWKIEKRHKHFLQQVQTCIVLSNCDTQ
ncbi:leucine-rich_repeat domain-containing protein [Hexamita inflata]|uniref:Leucine-rich repeat domain-containing protein n=1 Tax=Hexamita inflata TaxID=28002 RepID=A0AA86PYF7_9EUKA|nr:leucine-rich repeat domain-containing protein [Hexamita inflata]